MADRRKLQNEIDRTLKKVEEGVKLFQDLWEKVQSAPNPNQKEKFESELKKEIKKLQRLRDQIKTWITSGDIKDKKALLDARKLIEAQMERFKVVEKETKTKAYSKEGLGSVQKLDPLTREREELIGWLSTQIDSLKVHTDTCESELELLQVASKKKKLEKEKQERVDRLKYSLERHSYHIGRLEAIMRLLDNEAIDIEQVKKIKDDVEYYVQSNGEPDFKENEEMYDDLDIDETVIPDAASIGGLASTNTDDGDELGSPMALTSSGGLGGSLANNIGGTGTTNSHSPPSSSSNSPSPTPSLTVPSSGQHQSISQQNSINKARSTSQSSAQNNLNNRHNSGGSGGKTESLPTSANRPQMTITPLKQQSMNDSHYSSSSASGGKAPSSASSSRIMKPLSIDPNTPTVIIRPSTGILERAQSVGPSSANLASSNDQSSNQNNNGHHNSSSNVSSTQQTSFPFNFAAVAAQPPPSLSAQTSNGPSREQQQSIEHSPHSITSSHTSSSLMTSPSDGFQRTNDQGEMILKSGSGIGGLLTTATNSETSTNPGVSFAFKASQSVFGAPTQQPSTGSNQLSGRTSQTTSATGTPSQQPQSAGSSTAQQSTNQQAAALLAAVSSHYSNSLPGSWNSSDTAAAPGAAVGSLLPPSSGAAGVPGSMRSARISARQGISPLGKVQLRHDQIWQRKMVEAALNRVPMVGDSERVRHYLPRQPCPAPSYYPSQAVDSSSSLEFYKRLNVDSLFFVFYFMEGTKAQLLAAQALKDLAWRFHTRELTWFQRAETPKEVTETYEMGTYLYFDTQRWQTRKRENFRFEYQFLEDRNLQSYLDAAEATAQAAIAANSAAAAAALMMAANQASGTNSNGPASSALTGTGSTVSMNASLPQAGQQAVAAGGRK